MYCPRCGHQPISNDLRFCSYCGFRLGVVKASLADEEEALSRAGTNGFVELERSAPANITPPHRNINLGVVLMALCVALTAVITGRPGMVVREAAGLIVTVLYAATLLLSSPIIKGVFKLLSWGDPDAERLSTIKREMGFGATLMYLSTVITAITSLLVLGRVKTPQFALGLSLTFALLLVVSPQLLRAVRYLIREESSSKSVGGVASHDQALPPAREFVPATVAERRVITAEMIGPPASITEHTTNLLSDHE